MDASTAPPTVLRNYEISVRTGKELLCFISARDIKEVDCCFADPLGQWHHCTFHPSQITEDTLKHGLPFDGSSIPLLARVEKSDMLLKLDPSSCFIDPFLGDDILHVTCWIYGVDGFPCASCPRSLAERCQAYVKKEGFAEEVYIGFEAEFHIFDKVQFTVEGHRMSYYIDCKEEAPWNTGLSLGHKPLQGRGYLVCPPGDRRHRLRSEMQRLLERMGLPVEKHHHEVGACQHELGLRFASLRTSADWCMAYKYVVKNAAHEMGATATFLPKPLPNAQGSGMHVHLSFWKKHINAFYDRNGAYCNLSKQALSAVAGILEHAWAILALTNPTTNSYKRLVPGFEAPCCLVYSEGNRSAAIRIPFSTSSSQTRLEFRCPDPAACPYLAFSAIVMAAADGIKRQLEPPEPMEGDSYLLTNSKEAVVKFTPPSLRAALDALENDQQFLLEGGVFTKEFLQEYISLKRDECREVDLLPHPKEYEMYYHC